MALLNRNRPLVLTLLALGLILAWMAGQYEPKVMANVLLSGLTLGALYFLVASGLSLIFGLMDVLNFAHGTLFMFGAYVGFTLYANPRLLLNTLPFLLVLMGAAALSSALAAPLWTRITRPDAVRLATTAAWIGAVLLIVWALRGFNIAPLAAFAATAAGGAVATAQAQEAQGAFLGRLVGLGLGGLLAGLTLARGRAQRGDLRPDQRSLVVGGVLLVAAVAIALGRTGLEQAILGLSSDLRFVLALLAGALVGAAVGGLMEWGLIRPLYARPIYQVLMTLGLVYVGTEMIKAVWGPAGYYMDIPEFFNRRGGECPSPNVILWFRDHCSAIDVLGRPFPSYRLFIIVLGAVVLVVVGLLLKRSRLGMIIRAGVQDSEMVEALGINVRQVFTLVFALGAGLAALGGVAAAPFIGVNPGIGQEFLLQGFISVVIGGMGSYGGAALGALLVGLARAFGDQFVLSGITLPGMTEAIKLSPSIARASTVLIMALVLLLRPAGLFGKKE